MESGFCTVSFCHFIKTRFEETFVQGHCSIFYGGKGDTAMGDERLCAAPWELLRLPLGGILYTPWQILR